MNPLVVLAAFDAKASSTSSSFGCILAWQLEQRRQEIAARKSAMGSHPKSN